MNIRILIVSLFTLLLSASAQAQAPGMSRPLDTMVVNPDTKVDLKYIKMDLEVTPDTEYVAGSILFKGIATDGQPHADYLTLNLREQLSFDSAQTESGAKLTFNRMGEHIFVNFDGPKQPGQEFAVRVFYHGFSTEPDRKGMIHTTQLGDAESPNIIWTKSEPYGAKTWWPVKDNPNDKIDSVDLWFTCSAENTVASNGILKEVTPVIDGKHTFKWKSNYPIAHYLIAFACTKYDTLTTYWKYSATDSLPIQNFVYPGQVETWRKGLGVMPKILDAYQEWFGPYPFLKEKYGHVQWRGGGMEHQTISFVNNTDTSLLAHECSHQWWGDAITCASWNEIWLNEGFATYYTSRFLGRLYNEQAHIVDMAQKERFITERPGGSVFVLDSALDDVGRLFDAHTSYDKGAWVLHMLRYLVGDSTFDAVMKTWAMGPKRYGSATTPEFEAHFEAATGRDLKHFFAQWVFAEGYPQYQFSPTTAPLFGQWRTVIYLDQVPSATPVFFEMPVQVRVEGDGWDSLLVLQNTQYGQSWDMMFEKEPKRFVFDPFNHLLDGRVEQYLKVEANASDGIIRLQPNPVKRGGALKLTMSPGYSLRGYEVIDMRGTSVLRDSSMQSESNVSLNVRELPAGVYTIRVSILSDKGDALDRLEKFVIE